MYKADGIWSYGFINQMGEQMNNKSSALNGKNMMSEGASPAPKVFFLKRLLGMAPTLEADGRGYIPSPLGLALGVDKISGYKPVEFSGRKYNGDKKILVLCTEDRYFSMEDGVKFSTGHNVQETAVPLMHLTQAGFDFDVVTPTGAPAVLEEWSVPRNDAAVLRFMDNHKEKFEKTLSLEKLISDGEFNEESPYVLLFIPGGHGAMVGLPEDENVGTLIRWINESDRYLGAVCHGPAAMVAATREGQDFPYSGYSMVAFPDSIDKQSPSIGYLPGMLPWYQCEELKKNGINILNQKITGAVHLDRKLFSGDSPKACDKLGKEMAEKLLAEYAERT